jgi:hypothetical protein
VTEVVAFVTEAVYEVVADAKVGDKVPELMVNADKVASVELPVILMSSIRYCVVVPVCRKRILKFEAAGNPDTDLRNQVAVPVPVDNAVYEIAVHVLPSVLYSKSKSDPVEVVVDL